MASIGLHPHSRVGHDDLPNRVRHYPTDQTFVSDCSPPPLSRTQLPSTTRLRHYNLGKDLHLADSTRSQAHECGDSSPLLSFLLFFRRRSKTSVVRVPLVPAPRVGRASNHETKAATGHPRSGSCSTPNYERKRR